jgi:5-(aminomethyl)-3-furanmethanol phosphate kinase
MRVVKVGGSLFDLPDLGARLKQLLNDQPTLLVPGGGPTVDAVRAFDRLHRLSEQQSHWLALAVMRKNAVFIAECLNCRIVEFPSLCFNTCVVLDPFAFCRWEAKITPHACPFPPQSRREREEKGLPNSWEVTSDSIAARAAALAGADELILLKSTDPPDEPIDRWHRSGYVDPYFHRILAGIEIKIRATNFRVAHHQCHQ